MSLGFSIWVTWIMMIILIEIDGRWANYGVMSDGLLFEVSGEESKPDDWKWPQSSEVPSGHAAMLHVLYLAYSFPLAHSALPTDSKLLYSMSSLTLSEFYLLLHWKENIPKMINFASNSTNLVVFT